MFFLFKNSKCNRINIIGKPITLNLLVLTDEELVSEIIASNNTDLFGVLYDRFSSNIYNKSYSFVKSEEEAKDLTQDIFLKLYLKLPSYQGKSKFSTWLYSFTYNHCVNYVNRNLKKRYEKSITGIYDIENYSDHEVEYDCLYDDKEKKLTSALSQIPEKDRTILVLKYKKDLSIKKIENVLGIGSSAVKMRIKRAKKRLVNTYALIV